MKTFPKVSIVQHDADVYCVGSDREYQGPMAPDFISQSQLIDFEVWELYRRETVDKGYHDPAFWEIEMERRSLFDRCRSRVQEALNDSALQGTANLPDYPASDPASSRYGTAPSSPISSESSRVEQLGSSTSAFSITLQPKGQYPGYNAAPFQTQYLLNAPVNVHSNSRPYFCPVKGCIRGPGGLGFKRKNETIRYVEMTMSSTSYNLLTLSRHRHGLVHTSPWYICPFLSRPRTEIFPAQ